MPATLSVRRVCAPTLYCDKCALLSESRKFGVIFLVSDILSQHKQSFAVIAIKFFVHDRVPRILHHSMAIVCYQFVNFSY